MKHCAHDLIILFNTLFQTTENTILVGDSEEPLYLPADENNPHHRVIFTRDYFASALHEIAHWCIAGDARRLKIDYGYWYLPADENNTHHRIIFTRDYFASALHEIAHWCIAGDARRLKIDYGYWYFPEGRDNDQQKLFEQAEVKPQALECIFSEAAQSKFTVSQDNFSLTHEEAERFATLVAKQVDVYKQNGLPTRAKQFQQALSAFYQTL